MYVGDVGLAFFRNYRRQILHLHPGITVFVGENGQGKTNLVEAISYLSTLSSHRVASDMALVHQGENAALIQARVHRGQMSTSVEVEIYAGRANRARINRGNARPIEILGILTSVMFVPEDLRLVRGGPQERRIFLDELMVQLRPRMETVKNDYDKVLRQRGALLKNLSLAQRRGQDADTSTLDVWDDQLARLGAEIIVHRVRIISHLRPYVESYYRDISQGKKIARIDYAANVDKYRFSLPSPLELADENQRKNVEERENNLMDEQYVERIMKEALSERRAEEIRRGVNLVGPHRDDVELSLGTMPAKGYASHGESWSYALALRLASWDVLKEDSIGEYSQPILILDDVFAELDSQRRNRLAEIIRSSEQVLITAAVREDLPEELHGDVFTVKNGEIVDVTRYVEIHEEEACGKEGSDG